MSKKSKPSRPVIGDAPAPVVTIPPPTERERQLLADLRKWELRAKTLQFQVDDLVQEIKRRKRRVDVLTEEAHDLFHRQLNGDRFQEIIELVGKPVVYCPVCYALRLSTTGNSGTQLCKECSAKADAELWANEPNWVEISNNILRSGGEEYTFRYGLAK